MAHDGSGDGRYPGQSSISAFGRSFSRRTVLQFIALMAAAFVVVDVLLSSDPAAPRDVAQAWVVMAAALMLPLAVRWPVAGVAGFVVVTLLDAPFADSTGLQTLICYGLIFIVALVARPITTGLLSLALAAWSFALSFLVLGDLSFGAGFILLATVPLAIGVVLRYLMKGIDDSRRRVSTMEATQEAVRQRERESLARDLHDVVAHQLTLISLVSGSRGRSTEVGKLQEGMQEIRTLSSDALSELRQLLQLLRTGPEDENGNGTTERAVTRMSLHDGLNHLVERLESLGFTVIGSRGGLVRDDVAESTVISTLRIVQEATTNIVKYARPRSTVGIDVGIEGSLLHLSIESTTNTAGESSPGRRHHRNSSGEGILTMRERALLIGGEVAVGAVGGVWSVRGILPVSERR